MDIRDGTTTSQEEKDQYSEIAARVRKRMLTSLELGEKDEREALRKIREELIAKNNKDRTK